MRVGPNEPCPCHSERKFKKCCRLVLEGEPAKSPEALMRSRYSAYALGHVQHLMRSTHTHGPHWQTDTEAWRAELEAFCRDATFVGLEVLGSQEDGDRGLVDFRATMEGPGGRAVMGERSLFLKVGGHWRYHSGVRLEPDGAS